MSFLSKSQGSAAQAVKPYSAGVQTKLSVGQPGDAAEKEADHVARQVMESDKKEKAQKKAEDKKEEPGKKEQVQKAEEKKETKEDKKDVAKKEDQLKQPEALQPKEEQKDKPGVPKQAQDKDRLSKKEEPPKAGDDKKEKPAVQKKGAEKDKLSKKEEAPKAGDDKKEKPAVQKQAQDKDKLSKKEEPPKAADDKKEKPAQKKEAGGDKKEKPAIQQKPAGKEEKPVNRFVQAKDKAEEKKADNDEKALASLEEKINASKGSGKPMEVPVLQSMQRHFAQEFASVRIHTDGNAVEMCTALHAQAFTHGNDIYFNNGKYQPDTEQGKELLAHELTHVVQQTQHIHRMVQRSGGGGGAAAGGASANEVDDTTSPKSIKIEKLELPKLKERNSGKIPAANAKRPKGYKRSESYKLDDGSKDKQQNIKWQEGVQTDNDAAVTKLLDKAASTKDPVSNAYYLKWGVLRLIGTAEKIKENTKVPLWSKQGRPSAYDVDHIKELQLEGTNELGNMELLNFSANRSSGSRISNYIDSTVSAFLAAPDTKTKFPTAPDADTAFKDYDIIFKQVTYKDVIPAGEDFYSLDDIKKGLHLNGFEAMTRKEIDEAKGSDKDPIAYTSEAGGGMLKKSTVASQIPGFQLKDLTGSGTGDIVGKLAGRFVTNDKIIEPMDIDLNLYKMAGIDHGGYIKRRTRGGGNLETVLSNIKVKGLSPVEIETADIVPGVGIVAKGKIKPTVKILEGLEIDLTIEGNKIEISKTFHSGELKSIPPPFKVNDASITLFAGTAGIGVRGDILFEINKLGKGKISGSGRSDGRFELTGNFEFDKKIFNRADIELKYTHADGEDKFEAKGTINIPEGKLKGVKKADIVVTYAEGTLTAKGTADFDLPAVKKGQLEVIFTGEEFKMTGDFDLEHRLLKSGKIHAEVQKLGDEYKVNVSGNARPNITGMDVNLNVSYNDGVIDISGSAAYAKGMLSGQVNVGVTNRPVGSGGAPSGGPTNNFSIYGGGQLTLKLTPWLQGTAGVQFKPDGKMEVMGKIGIPGTVDVFPKKEINKELFRAPTIEIPLFAIPLGSHSIGIVATIGGGADAYASIGPGQLTEAAVEVKYDPDAEDATTVTGNAKFRVPTEAGIRLFARAGIGASVAIARVAGGIELGGSLAAQGAAEAGVQVNWSPSKGLKLDAEASISVQPKFKFDVTAFLEAKIDLWVTEIGKEWRKTLAAVEYGSAMKFGVKFPVHYEEGKDFDLSLDQVQFEKPDIDIASFAKGLGQQAFG